MNKGRNKPARLLSILGFVVLSTLFGVGIAWLLFAIVGIVALKHHFSNVVAMATPFLVGGGAVGFAVGLAIARWVSRSGPATEERIEARYVRRSDRLRIYGGAPIALSIAIISLIFPHLESVVGTRAF